MKKLTTIVSAAAAIAVIGFSTANAQVTTSEVRITNSTFRTAHTSNATANQTMRWEQFTGTGGVVKVTPGSPNQIVNGTVALGSSTEVSGELTVTNGGTGVNNLTDGAVLIGNGTGPIQVVDLGANQILRGVAGTADPIPVDLIGGAGITIIT